MRTITVITCVFIQKPNVQLEQQQQFPDSRLLTASAARSPCDDMTEVMELLAIAALVLFLFFSFGSTWSLSYADFLEQSERKIRKTTRGALLAQDHGLRSEFFLLPIRIASFLPLRALESDAKVDEGEKRKMLETERFRPNNHNNSTKEQAYKQLTGTKQTSEIETRLLFESLTVSAEPELVNNGNVSVVYKLKDETTGKSFAIFKPFSTSTVLDNDNLKSSSRRQILNEVAAYELDQNLTQLKLSAGVPNTKLTKLSFTKNEKLSLEGSLQTFVPNAESCEDFGPGLFPKDQVHKIGLLDLRILNLDRHSGNMLLQTDIENQRNKLVPIDHALAFPNSDQLKDVSFDWLMFPQAKLPFDEEVKQAVENIDIAKDIEILKKYEMSSSQIHNFILASLLLKVGVTQYGKTLFELGTLVQRPKDNVEQSSVFENLMSQLQHEIKTDLLDNKNNIRKFETICEKIVKEYFLQL